MAATKPRILIVEDESLIALSLKVELTQAGYPVCGTAVRGEEAVTKALDLRPDIILLDIGLKGGIDGFTVAERVQAATQDIGIVFVSGYIDEMTSEQAAKYRPLGCMSKPISLHQLRLVLETFSRAGETEVG